MLQLPKPFHVIVKSKGNAPGVAEFLVNPGFENDVIWGVVMDHSGEIWWIPNPEIRVVWNWTAGRRKPSESMADQLRKMRRLGDEINPL